VDALPVAERATVTKGTPGIVTVVGASTGPAVASQPTSPLGGRPHRPPPAVFHRR